MWTTRGVWITFGPWHPAEKTGRPEIEDGPSRGGRRLGPSGSAPGGRAERAWTMSRCQQYYTQSPPTTQVRRAGTLGRLQALRGRGKLPGTPAPARSPQQRDDADQVAPQTHTLPSHNTSPHRGMHAAGSAPATTPYRIEPPRHSPNTHCRKKSDAIHRSELPPETIGQCAQPDKARPSRRDGPPCETPTESTPPHGGRPRPAKPDPARSIRRISADGRSSTAARAQPDSHAKHPPNQHYRTASDLARRTELPRDALAESTPPHSVRPCPPNQASAGSIRGISTVDKTRRRLAVPDPMRGARLSWTRDGGGRSDRARG